MAAGREFLEPELTLAETRQAEREAQRIREAIERVLEDLDRAEGWSINAFRLLEDAS